MCKLIILSTALAMTGCATINPHNQPDQQRAVGYYVDREIAKQDNTTLLKTVGALVILGVVANKIGDANYKSKCANNRAGFWQDHSTGKIYNC